MTALLSALPANAFTVRPLTAFDAEDLRDIRLESLRHYGAIFDKFHAQESAKPSQYWNELCKDTRNGCFFGLFYGDELAGVMGAKTTQDDPNAALWYGNYTRPAYRGMGAVGPLYQLRADWTRDSGYKAALLYILDGATRPQAIIERMGAKRIHSEQMRFAGGPPALWHWYAIKIG